MENHQSNENLLKVFISYAWEQETTEEVDVLARFFGEHEVEAIYDRTKLLVGRDVYEFMEQGIVESDAVVILCTPTYKHKADKREGGVGYETKLIIEDWQKNKEKFIPVLLEGDDETSAMPRYMAGRLYLDARDKSQRDKVRQSILDKLKMLDRLKDETESNPKIVFPSSALNDHDLELIVKFRRHFPKGGPIINFLKNHDFRLKFSYKYMGEENGLLAYYDLWKGSDYEFINSNLKTENERFNQSLHTFCSYLVNNTFASDKEGLYATMDYEEGNRAKEDVRNNLNKYAQDLWEKYETMSATINRF